MRENAPRANAEVRIGADRYIRWRGPEGSRIFVEEDNGPRQLFASGTTGTQEAPWIRYGHRFTFILVDQQGRELARDVQDLRERRTYNYR